MNCFTIPCLWRGAPGSHHGLEGSRFSAPPSHLRTLIMLCSQHPPAYCLEKSVHKGVSQTGHLEAISGSRLFWSSKDQGSSHRMVPRCQLVVKLVNFVFSLARNGQLLGDMARHGAHLGLAERTELFSLFQRQSSRSVRQLLLHHSIMVRGCRPQVVGMREAPLRP